MDLSRGKRNEITVPYRALAVPAAPWPPTFAENFIEQARGLLDVRGVLVLVGPIDGSCQQLASSIAALPQNAGRLWSTHVCRFGDQDRPLNAIRQIFCAVPLRHLDTADEIEARLREELDARGDRPTVIVSNAGECDLASLFVLTRLAGSDRLRLIVTMTSGIAATHSHLLTRSEVIELPPLHRETVTEMIRTRWGVEPERQLVDTVLARTNGSYDVICEVIDAACHTGRLVVQDDRLVPSPDGAGLARQAGDDDLTATIAILGRVDLAEARTCFGEELIHGAVDRGVLQVQGAQIAFTAPSEGARIFWLLSRDRLVALFERHAHQLPATLGDPARAVAVAEWFMGAGRPLSAELAVTSARQANLLGQHRRAVAFTDPANVVGGVNVGTSERALAQRELGDTVGLQATWAAIDPQSLDEDELLPYLRWSAHQSGSDAPAGDPARALQGSDEETTQRRATVQTLADLIERSLSEGDDDIAAQLRTLATSAPMTNGNRAVAFACLSAVLRNSGRPDQAVEVAASSMQLIEAESAVSSLATNLSRELQILALIAALDLEGAAQALDAYDSRPASGTGRLSAALRCQLELGRGELETAAVFAQLCLTNVQHHDPHGIRGWIEALLAQMSLHLERLDDARQMLHRSYQHPCIRTPYDLERRRVQAAVLDQLAEPEQALELLQDVMTDARALGLRQSYVEAAALSVRVGGPSHLSALLEAVDGLDGLSGVSAIWQSFAHTARAYDIPALTLLADDLAARGTYLLAGQIAQFVLDMSRRATDLDPPTRARLQAMAELDPTVRARPASG